MKLLDPSLSTERYLSTYTGKQIHLQTPSSSQIDIQDIAHGLAHQCCFNGQTHHFYSIAQHSLLVATLVPQQHRLAALLHDAVSAYSFCIGATVQHLLPDFQLIEKKIRSAISEKFNVSGFDAHPIKRAHQIARATEQRDLLPTTNHALHSNGFSVPIPRRIELLLPEEAKRQFLELFSSLKEKPATVCQGAQPNFQFTEQRQSPDHSRASEQIRVNPGDLLHREAGTAYRHGLQAAWESARH